MQIMSISTRRSFCRFVNVGGVTDYLNSTSRQGGLSDSGLFTGLESLGNSPSNLLIKCPTSCTGRQY